MSMKYDDKLLANDVLERHFYKSFRQENSSKTLQFFLTGACHSNCEYCYLKKHLSDLYPIELHNQEIILDNFSKLVRWFKRMRFKCDLQIFSADWISTPLAEKVFNILYSEFSDSEYKPKAIILADNMQFLKSDNLTTQVENYIRMMDEIGIRLAFSASVDGKYCDFGRTPNSDEYYDKLQQFCKKYNIIPHPMISSNNVKYWIDNFKWWKEKFGEFYAYNMTLLEVRDNSWNGESINDLLVFCDFLLDDLWEYFKHDKEKIIKYIFGFYTEEEKKSNPNWYNPIHMIFNNFVQGQDELGCSNQKNLNIRVGDLTVAPCHRLHYPELITGYFNVENNEITDFEPKNISLLIAQRYFKRTCLPICEQCGLVGYCPGFCLGASYEDYKNMLVPQREVCTMYRSKYAFLIYKFYKMGLLDDMSIYKRYLGKETYRYWCDLIDSVLKDFKE